MDKLEEPVAILAGKTWKSYVVSSGNGQFRQVLARNEPEARAKARMMFGWKSPSVVKSDVTVEELLKQGKVSK